MSKNIDFFNDYRDLLLKAKTLFESVSDVLDEGARIKYAQMLNTKIKNIDDEKQKLKDSTHPLLRNPVIGNYTKKKVDLENKRHSLEHKTTRYAPLADERKDKKETFLSEPKPDSYFKRNDGTDGLRDPKLKEWNKKATANFNRDFGSRDIKDDKKREVHEKINKRIADQKEREEKRKNEQDERAAETEKKNISVAAK